MSKKSINQPQNLVFRLAPGQHAELLHLAEQTRRTTGENCTLSRVLRAAVTAITIDPTLIGMWVKQ